MNNKLITALLFTIGLSVSGAVNAEPLGSGFTYQGELQMMDAPADGEYDFQFQLYDAANGGTSAISAPFSIDDVVVSNGGFSVELDFDLSPFAGTQWWLEISVREGADTGAYTTLAPRQKLTAVPYALFALTGNEGPEGPVGATGPQGLQGDSHWQLNGNITYYNAGNVGVGTRTPGSLLGASGNAEQKVIYGHHTGTNGPAFGVYGESLSDSGTGVWGQSPFKGVHGEATLATGFSYGVRGESASDAGWGVFGVATSTTGVNFGVTGHSMSTTGHGVHGIASTGSGQNFGVFGESWSSSGRGVFGQATATSGVTYGGYFVSNSDNIGAIGVRGEGPWTGIWGVASNTIGSVAGVRGSTASTSGQGVFGKASAPTGQTNGGRFESASTSGRGLYAQANAASGTTYGVYGRSLSPDGFGVYGINTADNGETYGIYGQSKSPDGYGVYGINTSTGGVSYGGYFVASALFGGGVKGVGVKVGVSGVATGGLGLNVGVRGESADDSGAGVFGYGSATAGVNFGVQGRSASTSGRGVFGHADATTGVPIGVYAKGDAVTGYDFYADGAGVNYGGASSRRWKSNIVPIDNPLEKIARINGVYFDWDAEHGGHHDLGMIAEEVGQVMPEIVQYEENGVDAHGMDYSKVTPLLVEAVKALRSEKDAEISELRSKLANLEQIVEQLMSEQ